MSIGSEKLLSASLPEGQPIRQRCEEPAQSATPNPIRSLELLVNVGDDSLPASRADNLRGAERAVVTNLFWKPNEHGVG